MTLYLHHLCFYYTKKYIFFLLLSCLTVLGFSSCYTVKNPYYFKTLPKDTLINTPVNRLGESKIRRNDQLGITISSLNPAEDGVYNAGGTASASTTGSGTQVDINGNIQIHRLGNIHAEGMTRRELKERIENDIKPWLKDPLVTVRYLNHKITVLGEVGSQILTMPEEQLSILEVLGASSNVTPMARIDNVLIIRETETGKQFKRLNLEDHSIFTSPWYFLQPDDVVYVEPSEKRMNEEKRARYMQNLGLTITTVSFLIFILNLIIK